MKILAEATKTRGQFSEEEEEEALDVEKEGRIRLTRVQLMTFVDEGNNKVIVCQN